jgi:hypothetical protein
MDCGTALADLLHVLDCEPKTDHAGGASPLTSLALHNGYHDWVSQVMAHAHAILDAFEPVRMARELEAQVQTNSRAAGAQNGGPDQASDGGQGRPTITTLTPVRPSVENMPSALMPSVLTASAGRIAEMSRRVIAEAGPRGQPPGLAMTCLATNTLPLYSAGLLIVLGLMFCAGWLGRGRMGREQAYRSGLVDGYHGAIRDHVNARRQTNQKMRQGLTGPQPDEPVPVTHRKIQLPRLSPDEAWPHGEVVTPAWPRKGPPDAA